MRARELAEMLLESPLLIVFLVGVVMLLVGLEALEFEADWIRVDASGPLRRAVLLCMAAFLLGVPVWSFVGRAKDHRDDGNRMDLRSQRELYEQSMKKDDLEAAHEVHEQSALAKLKSDNLEDARTGVQEVAELGLRRPFRRGFNALAHELDRRNDWFIRLEILEALNTVAGPLRRQIRKSKE